MIKIFGKWSVQASKHTHACAQWSHASVGLAQARPNDFTKCRTSLVHMHKGV